MRRVRIACTAVRIKVEKRDVGKGVQVEEKNERKASREEAAKTRSELDPRSKACSGVGESSMIVKNREERI